MGLFSRSKPEDNVPKEVYNWYVYFVGAAASFGGALFG